MYQLIDMKILCNFETIIKKITNEDNIDNIDIDNNYNYDNTSSSKRYLKNKTHKEIMVIMEIQS